MSGLSSSVQRLRVAVLTRLRRGRPVAWTPGFMGFGNLLFLGYWCHLGRAEGEDRWFLRTPALAPWLGVFPGLAALSLERGDVRFTDRRVMPWTEAAREGSGIEDRTGDALDAAEVERFVRQHLLPLPGPAADPSVLVVNVRRGDYYDEPEHRVVYGFDVEGYVRVAVAASVAQDGPPSRIRVVTDGPAWCREHLAWLEDVAPVSYADRGADPVADFLEVAAARRLLITNSTFSYWAAFISNALHGDNHAEVHAPAFFDRTRNEGRSWLLDRRWSIVDDLPGGWDIPEA